MTSWELHFQILNYADKVKSHSWSGPQAHGSLSLKDLSVQRYSNHFK